jgi:TolB protein
MFVPRQQGGDMSRPPFRRFIILALTPLTLLLLPARADAQFPGRNGRFVDAVGDDIVTWPKNGGSSTVLVTMASGTEYPSWTPNGKAVVFDSNADGDYEIYRVPASGGEARQLTDNSSTDWGPHQGPDDRIVYVCRRPASEEICVMRKDGSHRRRLTDNSAEDWNPKWSTDGSLIVFSSTRADGNHDIWVMRSDGTHRRRLTDKPADEVEPDFSSDGRMIVFWKDTAEPKLILMRADGTHERIVATRGVGAPRTPSWAPNGSRIAYAPDDQIRTVRPDGTGHRKIVASGAGGNIGWQPR